MPNHFHLLLKQVADPIKGNSITNLMRRVIITYAMFIQKKYDHSGILFQGKFKNVLVSSDIQLLQLFKYIHRNPLEIQGSEPLQNYKYSSYKYYIEKGGCPIWLKTESILSFFSKTNPSKAYRNFIEEKPTQTESNAIKNITLE
jgi:putative transposase